MTHTIIQLAAFARRWEQFRLSDDDLRALERQYTERPLAGAAHVRNRRPATDAALRPPSMHSGKSGGYRVGYICVFAEAGVIVLMAIFPKSMQPNLTAAEKVDVRKLIESLKKRSLNHGQENQSSKPLPSKTRPRAICWRAAAELQGHAEQGRGISQICAEHYRKHVPTQDRGRHGRPG